MLEGEELLKRIKEAKGKVSIEILPDGEILSPFSTLLVRIKERGKVFYEGETLLKCDSFAGCFFCFNRDYSIVTLEKEREKISLPAEWKCLTWEGKPIFEDVFFEEVQVGRYFVGKRRNRLLILRFSSLLVESGSDIYRFLVDEHREYFSRKFSASY